MADLELDAAIALTRFGLGAGPGDLTEVRSDPRGWLAAQIRPQGADQPQPNAQTAAQRFEEFRVYRQDQKSARTDSDGKVSDDKDPVKIAQRMLREETGGDFLARAALGASTPAGFRERWTLFWANHFTVSATKLVTATLVGPFEQEAIRPHVFGKFASLLGAAETHPAMLVYLDQTQSIGPNSQAADFLKRPRARGVGSRLPETATRTVGLNENLAREILELHTVGINGGYSQTDVTEFARALTGLSISGFQGETTQAGVSVFRQTAHEPGSRIVRGIKYPPGGKDQAAAVLADLAAAPETARFICGKIAKHFVSDTPPPALVEGLIRTWMDTQGDLGQVAAKLIGSPDAWDPTPAKFKTPYEWMVSSWRAVGASPTTIGQLAPTLTGLGQKPFAPPSPKGWPDDAASWASADGLIKRMSWAETFASSHSHQDPKALAAASLGQRLTPLTAKAIASSESRTEGLTLLLMSPEFLRR